MQQHPTNMSPGRRRIAVARSGILAGLALGAIALACVSLNWTSAQQAVALALPGIVLTAGGMIVAAPPDPAAAWRHGLRTGQQIGSLHARWLTVLARLRARPSPKAR